MKRWCREVKRRWKIAQRFTGVDPLADKLKSWSPYNYALSNPIYYVDPDGKLPCPPGVNCEDPLEQMERIRMNRASNLGPGLVRRAANGKKFHAGHDLYAAEGTNVRAVMDGRILAQGTARGYGRYITIEHNVCVSCDDNGQVQELPITYYTFYSHLSEVNVETGEIIAAGSIIGQTGTSGNAEGLEGDQQHLHFEIGTELREGTNLLSSSGLVDPNLAYRTVDFSSANSSANQSSTGVIKRVIGRDQNILQIIRQNYGSEIQKGIDEYLYERQNGNGRRR